MMCQNCNQRQATYHSLKNINGQVTESYLCNECRRMLHDSMGMSNLATNMSIFGAMDTLSDFFGMLNAKSEQRPNTTVACDKCGTTYSEFKKTLYVGCQHCYTAFMEPMLSILKGLQNSTTHVGRIPKGMEHVQEYHNIRDQLKLAVAEERYEDAIALRERLKQLKL